MKLCIHVRPQTVGLLATGATMPRKFDSERQVQAFALRDRGLSIAKIAKELGITMPQARYMINRDKALAEKAADRASKRPPTPPTPPARHRYLVRDLTCNGVLHVHADDAQEAYELWAHDAGIEPMTRLIDGESSGQRSDREPQQIAYFRDWYDDTRVQIRCVQ